jgi:putative membrane protein
LAGFEREDRASPEIRPMERRHLLTGLAVALAATPAFAQRDTPQAEPPQGQAASGQIGDAEMRHLLDTMAVGMIALETARVGADKAREAEVKRFAEAEVAEQTTIAEVLRSMSQPRDPPQIDADGQRMLNTLRQAEAGRAFDRHFVEGQLMGHQRLLQIQEAYIQQGRNREHVNVAKLARGHIRDHIAWLQVLKRQVGQG